MKEVIPFIYFSI